MCDPTLHGHQRPLLTTASLTTVKSTNVQNQLKSDWVKSQPSLLHWPSLAPYIMSHRTLAPHLVYEASSQYVVCEEIIQSL